MTAKKKSKSKKLWRIRTYVIERSHHGGTYSITVTAGDIFEAGEKARKRYAKPEYKDYRLIDIQSIVYIGEVDA